MNVAPYPHLSQKTERTLNTGTPSFLGVSGLLHSLSGDEIGTRPLNASAATGSDSPPFFSNVAAFKKMHDAAPMEPQPKQPTRLPQTIRALPKDNYELVEPLDAILEYHEHEVIASLPELGIHGDGPNDIEAIRQLKLELLDLADIVYELEETALGPEPKQWKTILDRVLRRCP